MARSPLSSEFSLDPFDDHYELQDEIGRSVVHVYIPVEEGLLKTFDVVMGVAKSFDLVVRPHPPITLRSRYYSSFIQHVINH